MKAELCKMDDLDQKMIAALRRDSRMSYSDLASHLSVSRTTVRSRLERLVSCGDIVGFTVVLKEDVSDAPVRGLMMLGIEGRGGEQIRHRLTGMPQVQSVHSTNGKWDLIVEIGTDTLAEFDEVLFAIRRIEGVTTSETNLLLATRKAARLR